MSSVAELTTALKNSLSLYENAETKEEKEQWLAVSKNLNRSLKISSGHNGLRVSLLALDLLTA